MFCKLWIWLQDWCLCNLLIILLHPCVPTIVYCQPPTNFTAAPLELTPACELLQEIVLLSNKPCISAMSVPLNAVRYHRSKTMGTWGTTKLWKQRTHALSSYRSKGSREYIPWQSITNEDKPLPIIQTCYRPNVISHIQTSHMVSPAQPLFVMSFGGALWDD